MKFLVVGDAMTDVYWHGSVTRINPEKPSATLLNVNSIKKFPGGAANVAENLRVMLANVSLVSGNGSIVKNRLVDGDGILARFDQDSGLDPIYGDELLDQARGCDAVLVSDYAKGSITRETIATLRDINLPTFVDAKVNPDYWCDWATCMFPNTLEYTKAKRIYTRAAACVLKQSENGATLLVNGLQVVSIRPPVDITVRCVAGAGDTLFASYVACYMAMLRRGIKEASAQVSALKISMAFAAVAVSSTYTSAPTWAEVCKQAWSNEEQLLIGGIIAEMRQR